MQREHVGKPSNHGQNSSEWDGPERDDSGPTVLAMSSAAASGAIVGFVLAGHVIMGFAVFAGVFVGLMLGWAARGIVR